MTMMKMTQLLGATAITLMLALPALAGTQLSDADMAATRGTSFTGTNIQVINQVGAYSNQTAVQINGDNNIVSTWNYWQYYMPIYFYRFGY